jgi:hypothetical protein
VTQQSHQKSVTYMYRFFNFSENFPIPCICRSQKVCIFSISMNIFWPNKRTSGPFS